MIAHAVSAPDSKLALRFDQDEVQVVLMKTYPLKRNDGQIFAFEIPAAGLWTGSLARLLQRAPGVTNVRRIRTDMDRLSFEVNGELFLVWEPWGSNSRYWSVQQIPLWHRRMQPSWKLTSGRLRLGSNGLGGYRVAIGCLSGI